MLERGARRPAPTDRTLIDRLKEQPCDLLYVFRRPGDTWHWQFYERNLGLMAESPGPYSTRDSAHAAAAVVLGAHRLGWMRPIRREHGQFVTVQGGVNQTPRPDVLIAVTR